MNAKDLTDTDWKSIFKAIAEGKEAGRIFSLQPDGEEIEGFWSLTDSGIQIDLEEVTGIKQ